MKLESVKEIPLGERVKRTLKSQIKTMDLNENNKLPREEMLAKQLNVSRITIRKVLTELEQEGLIYRIHGKGTFVNTEASCLNVMFSPPGEFSQMISMSGYHSTIRLLSAKKEAPYSEEAQKLHMKEGELLYVVKKLFLADGHPAIYCIDRFPAIFLTNTPDKKFFEAPIFDILSQNAGIDIVRDITELFTTTNVQNPELIPIFDNQEIKSYLVSQEVDFDINNTPVLFSNVYYDTDFVRFKQPRQKSFA